MIYMILEKLGSGITNRNGYTGTLESMKWKSTLRVENCLEEFLAIISKPCWVTLPMTNQQVSTPASRGLIITKGLVSCGSWVLRPGVDKL